eukprot:CAMPEP_0177664736 /NCGR_PEP_ID=MMETSP0447-20121125/20666_1 /TAXON_ID=0 /ORGANISM="Stygamoeba regulata, Strain BSH-02190019" /LENGTH=276 /DNA_ID=CAMNT_0019170755 /DNA_START=47 /DNA_END=877 /DNA_ORIENTATION=-
MSRKKPTGNRSSNARSTGWSVCKWLWVVTAVLVGVLAVALGVLAVCEDCRHRVFAACMTHVVVPQLEKLHRPLKDQLLGDDSLSHPLFSGELLELGPGSGTNFKYMTNSPFLRWHGAEPNDHFRESLLASATEAGLEPATEASVRENLLALSGEAAMEEYARQGKQFDVILCTLVLCSVPDPAALLKQVHDRLVPGGRFFFFEHVGAPEESTLAMIQRFMEPLWQLLGDGCHISRDTARLVNQAGFEEVELRTVHLSELALTPHHILGVATKQMID